MAFLAKKVPKIFPSTKTRKGHDDILLSPRHGKKKGAFLFRRLIREPSPGNQSCEQEQTPINHNNRMQQLDTVEPLDCCGESKNQNFPCNSDGHSHASTLESSPTPLPRETMDPNVLVLPDLPTLEFPSPKGITESINENINSSNPTSTPLPPSLRLVPRPISHETESPSPPPPVALISFPIEFAFPPPPKSRVVVANSCLTRPPPRACEWDDATIESHELLDSDEDEDDDKAETDNHVESSLTQQQVTTNAQASIIMKPWLERAARLALLQNRANRIISHTTTTTTSFAPVDRQRHPTLLKNLPDHNPRALLASLEKKTKSPTTTTTRIASKTTMTPSRTASDTNFPMRQQDSSSEEDLPQTNRVVKWHVVRKPYK